MFREPESTTRVPPVERRDREMHCIILTKAQNTQGRAHFQCRGGAHIQTGSRIGSISASQVDAQTSVVDYKPYGLRLIQSMPSGHKTYKSTLGLLCGVGRIGQDSHRSLPACIEHHGKSWHTQSTTSEATNGTVVGCYISRHVASGYYCTRPVLFVAFLASPRITNAWI
jgi:hypothetical protein